MTRSVATGPLAAAAAHTEAGLAAHAPHLLERFRAALPGAADTVGRRLRSALVCEDIGDARQRHASHGRGYAFDRVEFDDAGVPDPVDLLRDLDAPGFAAELRNAVINLAVATARHTPPHYTGDADVDAITDERRAVAGHNLHPCGRTRLGWSTADTLAHDLESAATTVGFIAVRHDAHLGDDLGEHLSDAYPQLPAPPPGFRLQPVHAWQRDTILPARYPELFRDGVLRPIDAELTAIPTAALRTLLLPPGRDGHRRYAKVSLDIQVTSTRRSISVASTRNGPILSVLLYRMVDADPDGHRLILLAETAGAAVPTGSGRDMSAILRDGLAGRLAPDETAIPGGALPARLTHLLEAYARTLGRDTVDAATALAWFDAYARLLLPPLLRLCQRGIAYEGHLQNCLPTFTRGVPTRLVLRDFAGLRIHPGRLAAAGHTVALWPGSVIGTDDADTFRAKLGYTAFQAHLGELAVRLHETYGLAEDAAWRTVRAVVDETYDGHGSDHAAFTAPRVPHKALVRMRLADDGDTYLPVRNPLHAPA